MTVKNLDAQRPDSQTNVRLNLIVTIFARFFEISGFRSLSLWGGTALPRQAFRSC